MQSTVVGESSRSLHEEFCWDERSNCQLEKNPGYKCKCYQTLDIPKLDIIVSIETATVEERFSMIEVRLDHFNVVEVALSSKLVLGEGGSFHLVHAAYENVKCTVSQENAKLSFKMFPEKPWSTYHSQEVWRNFILLFLKPPGNFCLPDFPFPMHTLKF